MKKIISPILIFSLVCLYSLYPKITVADVVYQSNYIGSTAIGFGDVGFGRDFMCQGFKVSKNISINAISFRANSVGGGNVGFAMWIDNADSLSAPLGAVATGIGGFTEITSGTVQTGIFAKYYLSQKVPVIAGNQYSVCFSSWNTSTHATSSSYNDWVSSISNPYPDGRRTSGDTAYTTWVASDAGNADMLFEIYGEGIDADVSINSQVNIKGQVIIQ